MLIHSILDSEEIRASRVERVKPAKCSESSNPIELSRRLMAISWWRRRWCKLVAAGTVFKDSKACFKIYYKSQGSVCNDNVAMFSPLAHIKIFRLNRRTRRDVCAIFAHNQVCCRSTPVYPGAPDRQNQVCYIYQLLVTWLV